MRSGLRGRSFQAVFLLGLFLIFVAYLSGSFSPRQPRTVALDIGLSGMRLTLLLLNLFWVQELIAQEIERKSVLFSLTYPVRRETYLFGRYFAVLGMSALATVVLGLCLVIAVNLAGSHYFQEFLVTLGHPLVLTLFGIWVDASVVASFALWIATVSTVPVLAVALGLAFALAGKALGATVAYLAAGADGDAALTARFGPLIDTVRWVLPDLSRLDWRDWPLYGVPAEPAAMAGSLLMAASYVLVMLLLAARAFRRREFA